MTEGGRVCPMSGICYLEIPEINLSEQNVLRVSRLEHKMEPLLTKARVKSKHIPETRRADYQPNVTIGARSHGRT